MSRSSARRTLACGPALEAIGDAEHLEALAQRLLAATSWDDLLSQS